ncbi:endonuclease/exonuclease/phosphatase family protein [Mycobacterium sp. NPDC003323]
MRARIRDRRRGSSGRPRLSIPFVIGILTLVYVIVALTARALPLTNLAALVLVASSPYLPLAALLACVTLALCRRTFLAVAAAAALISTLLIQVPWYYGGRPADVGTHAEIRVLSSNLRYGEVNADFFVDLAEDADVITVSELTKQAVQRLADAGIDKAFPHSILVPRPQSEGMGLYSRYPLTRLPESEHGNNFVAARLRIPGVRHDPLVSSVHLMSPIAGGANTFEHWRYRILKTKAEFADYDKQAGPAAVIIAGDFNATVDMRQFRDLLDTGYQDAVRQTGAGFSPTYSPNRLIPPLITIDHVLTRNSTATSIHTVKVPGTDHRALLATVAVPLDPAAD